MCNYRTASAGDLICAHVSELDTHVVPYLIDAKSLGGYQNLPSNCKMMVDWMIAMTKQLLRCKYNIFSVSKVDNFDVDNHSS